MSLLATENLFLLIVWIIAAFIVEFILILVMHFLMPKQVLEKYFKPPYFQPGECDVLTGFPYSPIRTVIFMTAFAFPGMGKNRKLTEAYEMVPGWYRKASEILVIALIVLTGATLCVGAVYYIVHLFK